MRRIMMTLIFAGLFALTAGRASERPKFSAIEQSAQIAPEAIKAKLVEKEAVFADSWWPTDLAPVNAQAIPKPVYVHAARWLRTMIKPQWLPDDPNAWMVGVRKPKPREADYLILRYMIGAQGLQILEDGAGVSLLIDTGAFADMEPDAFLKSVIRKFLRYPEDKLGTLKFFLESFEHDGRKIYYGSVDCDFDRYDREAHFKRIWYNYTFLWTDGRRVFFSLVEMDGQPPKRKQVHPGIARRFKPAK